jgi:hypothetical protein
VQALVWQPCHVQGHDKPSGSSCYVALRTVGCQSYAGAIDELDERCPAMGNGGGWAVEPQLGGKLETSDDASVDKALCVVRRTV